MPRAFFPDPAFGWVYCTALGLLTCVAAYADTRTAKIPNRLNLVILAVGFLANVIRSAWMGAEGKPLWVFETGSLWLGLLDGILFALLGFVVAFGAMLAVWIFGLCGGGDVKLLAAIAVWIGFDLNLILIWLASVVVLFFWTGARVFSRGLTPKGLNRTLEDIKKRPGRDGTVPARRNPVRVTYSVPVAVATIVVLLWVYRFELLLAVPKAAP